MSQRLIEDDLLEPPGDLVPFGANRRRQSLGVGPEALMQETCEQEGLPPAAGRSFRKALEDEDALTSRLLGGVFWQCGSQPQFAAPAHGGILVHRRHRFAHRMTTCAHRSRLSA